MDIQMHAVNIEYVESVREILQDALQFKQSLGDGTWGAEPYTIQEVQQLLKRGEVYIFTNQKNL